MAKLNKSECPFKWVQQHSIARVDFVVRKRYTAHVMGFDADDMPVFMDTKFDKKSGDIATFSYPNDEPIYWTFCLPCRSAKGICTGEFTKHGHFDTLEEAQKACENHFGYMINTKKRSSPAIDPEFGNLFLSVEPTGQVSVGEQETDPETPWVTYGAASETAVQSNRNQSNNGRDFHIGGGGEIRLTEGASLNITNNGSVWTYDPTPLRDYSYINFTDIPNPGTYTNNLRSPSLEESVVQEPIVRSRMEQDARIMEASRTSGRESSAQDSFDALQRLVRALENGYSYSEATSRTRLIPDIRVHNETINVTVTTTEDE